MKADSLGEDHSNIKTHMRRKTRLTPRREPCYNTMNPFEDGVYWLRTAEGPHPGKPNTHAFTLHDHATIYVTRHVSDSVLVFQFSFLTFCLIKKNSFNKNSTE